MSDHEQLVMLNTAGRNDQEQHFTGQDSVYDPVLQHKEMCWSRQKCTCIVISQDILIESI